MQQNTINDKECAYASEIPTLDSPAAKLKQMAKALITVPTTSMFSNEVILISQVSGYLFKMKFKDIILTKSFNVSFDEFVLQLKV